MSIADEISDYNAKETLVRKAAEFATMNSIPLLYRNAPTTLK